jgi:outer membrane protein
MQRSLVDASIRLVVVLLLGTSGLFWGFSAPQAWAKTAKKPAQAAPANKSNTAGVTLALPKPPQWATPQDSLQARIQSRAEAYPLEAFEIPAFFKPWIPEPTHSHQTVKSLAPSVSSAEEPISLLKLWEASQRYHPRLQMAYAKLKQQEGMALNAQGSFDPRLSGSNQYLIYNSSSKPGDEKDAFLNDVGVEFQTRSGANVKIGGKLNRGTLSTPVTLTGEGGEYGLEVKQPLIRGFGINKLAVAEQKAGLATQSAWLEWQQTRYEVLRQASNSYWSWVANELKRLVTQDLLDIANLRYQQVQGFAKAGDLPKIDAVEAQQEVFRRETTLAEDTEKAQKAAYDASLFYWPPPAGQAQVPSQLPKVFQPEAIPDHPWLNWKQHLANSPCPTLEELQTCGITQAFQNRPELKSLSIGKLLAQIDWSLAKNEFLPKLDAILAPGFETGQDSVAPVLKAGIEYTVPLRQRTVRGQLQQATFKLSELNQQEQAILANIRNEVAKSVVEIQQRIVQVEKGEQQVQLAIQLEEAERRRYDLGDSTLFLVNTRERAAVDAKKQWVDAQASLQQAWVQFWVATALL